MADPIVALATPPSTSQLAIIRLDGVGSIDALLASVASPVSKFRPRQPCAIDLIWNETGETVPSIAITYQAPASFTGGEGAEILVPGSPLLIRSILEQFRGVGVRPATPGEFTRRAFVARRIDLTRAESVAALIEAEDLSAADAARRGLAGDLALAITAIASGILDLVAFLEAGLDFTEQEVEGPEGTEVAARIAGITAEITSLLERRRQVRSEPTTGRLLLWGRPNAGKSTLLNALAGRKVALTSGEPGTTTDPVSCRVQLTAEVEVEVVDLPGCRQATGSIEARALAISRRWLENGDPILYLLDGSCDEEQLEVEWQALEPEVRQRSRTLLSKIDLRRGAQSSRPSVKTDRFEVSARTGEGLVELKRDLATWIIGEAPLAGESLIFTDRQSGCLRECQQLLEGILDRLVPAALEAELLVVDLKRCLTLLEEVTGEATTEQILDRIFAKFCLGK